VLHHLLRLQPMLELSNFYHLINAMGVLRIKGSQIEDTCLADLFRLYRPALPGRIVPVNVTSPHLAEATPAVDAACLKNDAGEWLFMVNRDLSETAELKLPAGVVVEDSACMIGQSLTGQFTAGKTQIRGGTEALEPLSIHRLRVQR
jgi:hypothetical protein